MFYLKIQTTHSKEAEKNKIFVLNLKAKQFIDTFIGLPLVYINRVFARLFGFLLKRNHSIEQYPEHIIFIKLLGYGSVVLASDAIHSIKQKYPKAKTSIICSSGIYGGVKSLKLFDEILILQDNSFWGIISSTFQILIKLWSRKHKWIIDLEVYSKLTSILSLWTLGTNRFGFYFHTVAFRYNLNTHNIFFNSIVPIQENYNRMAESLGVDKVSEYKIKGYESRNENREFKYIAVNNTCSDLSLERKMSEEQYIDICNWILKQTDYHLALLGAPSDFQSNEEIRLKLLQQERVINTAGKFVFDDYYKFLFNECKLLITIDSAPLHIANKLSIPNLSIWGPTRPGSGIKFNANNPVLYHAVTCSPCVHVTNKLPCGGDNFCMKKISLQETIDVLLPMLTQYKKIIS